jgi:phage N-6-adenine-methyltransferase
MTEPRQRPGRSKQDYRTPPEFLAAVRARLGIEAFAFDFATDGGNAVAQNYFLDSSLDEDWPSQLPRENVWGWLNPPYANLAPWVKKAYESAKAGAHIAALVPAGVGANWWRDWVHEKADVLLLNGRLTFVGCTAPYPKDCALLLYHPTAVSTGGCYDVWSWRLTGEPGEELRGDPVGETTSGDGLRA